MKIPLEFYNYLRNTIRISDIVRMRVALTKKGAEYSGICPFHDEKTPSFTVNDAKQFYHCFGCSAHGDAIKFVSETSGISYKEAAIKIANDNGVALPKISKEQEQQYKESDKIYNILDMATQFFASNLNESTKKYLNERGIKEETIKKFLIGYAPGNKALESFFEKKSISLKDLFKSGLVGRSEDGRMYEIFNNRIIFPIKNIYNKTIGFGGRAIGNNLPKYINSPETMIFKKGETMYGENLATSHSHKSNYSIIVEGYMDVVALHQAGFNQAVASLGTSVTEKHVQKLWRSSDEIISCLDGDNAGIRAQNRLINMALPQISANKIISFVQLPEGLDPDDVIKSKGSGEFSKIIASRLNMSEMIWQNETRNKNFSTAESRSVLENKFDEYCNLILDKTLKINYKRYFKDLIWNNLLRKKKLSSNNETVSQEVTSFKKHSELEFLEQAICRFVIKHPEILKEESQREGLADINFKDNHLNDLKDWFVSIISEESRNIDQLIEQKIKNTSFYDSYLVLCSPSMLFLDLDFLNEGSQKHGHVLKWLCKKHYLLLLKMEQINITTKNTSDAQFKSSSYLEEIQKISQELAKLSEEFIS